MTKVFVFGIDGASPDYVFDKWLDDLPNIKKLINTGCYAKNNTIIPPATILAWTSLFSGKDASEIGVFNYTYKDKNGKSRLVSSKNVKCKLIWDILSEKRKNTIALYVPLTYPVKPINGSMVSGFLTPDLNDSCCYPKELKSRIKELAKDDLFFDVAVGLASHKGLQIQDLLDRTYRMTKAQIVLLKDLIVNEDWDLFAAVMIGTDRLQHMLWRHFDETHRRFIKDSSFKDALKNYYIYLDKKLGEILELLDDDTVVIVASDHGMIKQEGKININNWLMQEGYLVLTRDFRNKIKNKTAKLKLEGIDWKNTIAYGGGAYNARVYINKEKAGGDYDRIIEEITQKLKDIPDDNGNKLDTKVFRAKDIYSNTSDPNCPDLTVYFDNLRWASNPDFGQEGLYSWKTAVGADNAGHSTQGCFIISGKAVKKEGYIGEIDIRQIAPTILKLMNVEIPKDIKFEVIKDALL